MSELPISQGKQLQQAVLNAQAAISDVPKDQQGTDEHGRTFQYTSAETMVEHCRKALLEQEVLCVRGNVNATGEFESSNTDAVTLQQTFTLVHVPSGEAWDLNWDIPAIASLGNRLDKAIAASLTTSLSYFLRDLLLVPRFDVTMEQKLAAEKQAHGLWMTQAKEAISKADSFERLDELLEKARARYVDKQITEEEGLELSNGITERRKQITAKSIHDDGGDVVEPAANDVADESAEGSGGSNPQTPVRGRKGETS